MVPPSDQDPAACFAAVLRARRVAAGLTQQDLAEEAGLGVRTVRDLERARVRRPQRGTLELLADALRLTGTNRDVFVTLVRPRDGRDGPEDGAALPVAVRSPYRPVVVPEGPAVPLPPVPDLVGRDADVAELVELVPGTRLVSLVGLAGVGKTCLALTVAVRCTDGYPGGVAFVAVGDGAGRDEILAAVASALRVARVRDLPERCAARPVLLVMDGADRSPGPVAAALVWLRSRAPTVAVLVTSRRPVALPDVVEQRVDPLVCPPPGGGAPAGDPLDDLRRYPAAALFLARLRQVRRRPVTDDEVPIVSELVRRLGGLPLALELAAARGRVLDLPELLRRYGDRVLDLGGAAGGGSLRDAVGASYQLLDPRARWALRQLAIFTGRWSLELAEGVLDESPPGSAPGRRGVDAERLVDRLIGHGLVNVRDSEELRFGLLDVVRDFAAEELARRGELEAARTRQARVLAEYAVRIAPDLEGGSLPSAAARLDALAGDVRAALDHAVGHDPVTALRLAGAIVRWYRLRGRDRELRAVLRNLFEDPRSAAADRRVHAWARLGSAMLAVAHGDGAAELPTAEAALETFVVDGDVAGELAARGALCDLWWVVAGGYDRAYRHAVAIRALAGRSGRVRDLAVGERNLAWHDVRRGELATATRRLETVTRLAGEVGDVRMQVLAGADLAEVARLDRRYDAAVEQGRRALVGLAELGDHGRRARVLATVGQALAEGGERDGAEAVLDELTAGGEALAGVRGMIAGYLALTADDRPAAASLFEEAVAVLADRYDVRDVLEALVGVAACTGHDGRRDAVMSRITQVCHRGGLRLLPRDRALLAGADRAGDARGRAAGRTSRAGPTGGSAPWTGPA